MLHAHVDKNSAVPWWAAFGAPLVGVPLLVILLALGAPKKAQSDPVEATKVYTTTTEQVDPTASTSVQVAPTYKENGTLSRC